MGEFVPTGKAVVWPYFVYSDVTSARQKAIEKQKTNDYLKSLMALREERTAQQSENNREQYRIIELEGVDSKTALQDLFKHFKNINTQVQDRLVKVEKLNPPSFLQEYHNLLLDSDRDLIHSLNEFVSACPKGKIVSAWTKEEKEKVATAHKRFASLARDYEVRLKAEYTKALSGRTKH